jgi:endonuclease YncB( thermonuclease family)
VKETVADSFLDELTAPSNGGDIFLDELTKPPGQDKKKPDILLDELTKPKDEGIDAIPVIGTYSKEIKHALSTPDAKDFVSGFGKSGANPGQSIFNAAKGAKTGVDLAGALFSGTVKNVGNIFGKGEDLNKLLGDFFVRGVNNPINQAVINYEPRNPLNQVSPGYIRKILYGDTPDGAAEFLPMKGPSSEDVVKKIAKESPWHKGKDLSPEDIQKDPLLWSAKTGLDLGEMIVGGKLLHAGTKAIIPPAARAAAPIINPVISPLKQFVKDNTPAVIQKWMYKEGETPLDMAEGRRALYESSGKAREIANEIVTLMTYASENGIVPSKLKGRRTLTPEELADMERYVEIPEARWQLEKGTVGGPSGNIMQVVDIIRGRMRDLENLKLESGMIDATHLRRVDPRPAERTPAEDITRAAMDPADQNYIPHLTRGFFQTVLRNADETVLQKIIEQPDFATLPLELQETIKGLVMGGDNVPAHLGPSPTPTGAGSTLSMNAMRRRKDLSPQIMQMLGGEAPKTFMIAKGVMEGVPTSQLLKFVQEVIDKGYRQRSTGGPGKNQIAIGEKMFGESALGRKIAEMFRQGAGTGEHTYLHKGIFNELKSYIADRGMPDIGTIGKSHEFVLNPWKKMTTILWPKTALNNSIWNKTVSWIMTGNKQKSDREFTQRSMNTASDAFESQVAEAMGIRGSSFVQAELASESSLPMAKQIMRSIKPPTILDKTMDLKEAVVDKAAQWYQGSEVKAKMEIGCARLRELGYEFHKYGDRYDLVKDGRRIQDKKDFTLEDLRAFKDAGDMGNFALFDYADVSRAVKLLNRTTHPFLTFGTKIMPLMMRLAVGVGHNGQFSAARAARFWSVPIMSKMLTEFSKNQTGMSETEFDSVRDARQDREGRRILNTIPGFGDAISDTVNPLLPFSSNPKKGKTMWGRDKDAGYLPTSAGLANALPYAQIMQPQGNLGIPALAMPGGPIISNLSVMLGWSDVDPYTGRKVISKESPDRVRDATIHSLQKALPPAYLAKRIIDASQGEAPWKGAAPETVPGAVYNVGSPIKLNVTNVKGAEFGQDTAKKDMEADIKRKQELIDRRIEALNGKGNIDPRIVKQLELEKEIEDLKPRKRHLEVYAGSKIKRQGSPDQRAYQDVSERLEKAEQAKGGILQGIKSALSGKDKISDIYHKIQDGDTFDTMYHGQKITVRVSGIDAPETDHAYQGKKGEQPFSERSKRFAEGMISGRKLKLNVVTKDEKGRLVARVISVDKDGKSWDLAQELVKAGLAWHYQEYTKDKQGYNEDERETFRKLETEAMKERKGLWKEDLPIKPSDWRHGR